MLPYRKRKDSLCQKEHTNTLLDACAEVIIIQEECRPNIYSKRNLYMVEHADRVIAVYDGREKGGTVKTIRYAHQFRKELRKIPVGLILDKNRTNLDKTRYKKVDIQTAIWYNKFSTVKVSDNPVGLTDNDRSPFVEMGNHSLKEYLHETCMYAYIGGRH